jgi:predicted transcriptional regulator
MKLQLIGLCLFFDMRKHFLLRLVEGAIHIGKVLDFFQVFGISAFHHIKKLKEEGLILQKGDIFRLSTIF